MPSFILTVIGIDRPGLVRTLADTVAASGGSWLESRMARLAGQFAGIVRVEAPDSLLAKLESLAAEGLQITAERAGPAAATQGETLVLEGVGNDRPGLVRDDAAARIYESLLGRYSGLEPKARLAVLHQRRGRLPEARQLALDVAEDYKRAPWHVKAEQRRWLDLTDAVRKQP